jgi:opacity protein-like surface antigen
MNAWRLIECAMVAGVAATAEVRAEPHTLGSDYVRFDLSSGRFGDKELDEALGDYSGTGLTWNLVATSHADLQIGIGYLWADGSQDGVEYDADQVAGGFTLIGYMDPIRNAVPYGYGMLGAFYSGTRARTPEGSETDSRSGSVYAGGAGVEVALSRRVLLDLSAGYAEYGGDGTWAGEAAVGWWATDAVLVSVGGGYQADSEDTTATLGVVWRY